MGRGRLCLLGLSEWGGGPCLSRVLGGGVRGGGFWAVGCPHWGRVSLGSCHFPPPRSSREGPPPRPPFPPPRPIPGAASTIPLICNDFCLFLSFSFSDLPPSPAASMRRHRPYPLRFGSFPVCLLSCQWKTRVIIPELYNKSVKTGPHLTSSGPSGLRPGETGDSFWDRGLGGSQGTQPKKRDGDPLGLIGATLEWEAKGS